MKKETIVSFRVSYDTEAMRNSIAKMQAALNQLSEALSELEYYVGGESAELITPPAATDSVIEQ